MSDKNDLADWADSLNAEEAPVEGLDKETLRRAMRLNPAMKAQLGSTNKVVVALERAAKNRAANEGKNDTQPPKIQAASLAEGVKQSKERFHGETRRLQQQLAKAQEEIAKLKPQTLERLIDMVIDADPSMSNIYTQELLRMEAAFFTEVGFSPRKVIERQMKVTRY